MIYRAIGLMSGSSMDGLDIAYIHFFENAGKWSFDIIHADCYTYTPELKDKLQSATSFNALNYQLLHTAYGHYLGEQVNAFINKYQLHYKVQLIASHGHTTFHVPAQKMTAQLGDGAAIAAETGIPVVSDLRALDIALGGQGAPIVPIGDKLLFGSYNYCLNIGGIANISASDNANYISFDICAANRVLNMLAEELGKPYDNRGELAKDGSVQNELLQTLNGLDFYNIPYPKSLSNDFGISRVYPLLKSTSYKVEDLLATYSEHIVIQIRNAVEQIQGSFAVSTAEAKHSMLVTGGGAYNDFLIHRLQQVLSPLYVDLIVPETNIIEYKEAVVMALIGVLRWREENNILSSVTGAIRSSIGGAVWMGAEA
ncbi:MAG: anhydro-N-acetylmuramic acid kinase [Agriterribacter sp.]